jgi:hypothetical protein
MTAIRKGDIQSPVFDRFQHVEPRGSNATVLLRTSQNQVALDEVLEKPERPCHLEEGRVCSRRVCSVVTWLSETHQAAPVAAVTPMILQLGASKTASARRRQ